MPVQLIPDRVWVFFRQWVRRFLRGEGHEPIHRVLLNPANLVAVGAPFLINISLAFFVLGSSGSYATLLKTPEVCALLEHRTQLYTAIVALAFCLLQIWRGPSLFRGGPTANRNGWALTLTIILGVVCAWFTSNGWFMNESELNLYMPGACMIGKYYLPPLMSPITWFRAIILAVATISAVSYLQHHEEG